ncbi:hypothetical protein [Chryseobacterium sp. POL2]|uniref:hypothetical protein n=1 Tax=Chryseobacterium sp. POL2 TaxID=2713414 RepID=UPI0013E1FBFD|nr:hypothetical protein [Chryseobacterium sp. POL2]QIG90692.1 hypothetical protein G6R40_14015 [Chryseobacterium sp. POL2]
MQIFYKIFLVLFVVFIGINIYGINWNVGMLEDENSKFMFSIAASIIGIIVIYIMSTWQKVGAKK